MNKEELELCKAAQAGDKKAFDTMVTRNLGLVAISLIECKAIAKLKNHFVEIV
jgi:hypothetical protein